MEKIKTTQLCKALLLNAKYTDSAHFVSKTKVGEETFAKWQKALKILCHNGFEYYKGLEEFAEDSDRQTNLGKEVYSALKDVLSLVGKIPTADGKAESKINSAILFYDVIRCAVKDDGKKEVSSLVKAREEKATAMKEYRKNCLTDDGFVKNGLQQSYIDSHKKAIETAQAKIEKLLSVANNSVYSTTEVKSSAFAKKFEIALRKQMTKQYSWTSAEVKAEAKALADKRKSNRGKANKTEK